MGLVKIKGRAKESTLLTSPLGGIKCVLYKFLIQELRGSGKHRRWETIASGDSFFCPFWLHDDTGKIKIFSEGSDLITKNIFRKRVGRFEEIPINVKQFMNEHGISCEGLFDHRPIMLTEWFVRPEEDVFILGSAKKPDINPGTDYNTVLHKQLVEFKKDAEKMKEADLNNDGNVDLIEWDKVVLKIKQKAYEEVLNNTKEEGHPGVIIGKGEDNIFVISDYSENKLTKNFSLRQT